MFIKVVIRGIEVVSHHDVLVIKLSNLSTINYVIVCLMHLSLQPDPPAGSDTTDKASVFVWWDAWKAEKT